VDNFSSKLDLPRSLETVESIDANHMQMAKCRDKADPQYRAIIGVLQQFIYHMMPDGNRTGRQGIPATVSGVKASAAETGSGIDGALTS
jgi:hypothetical protein